MPNATPLQTPPHPTGTGAAGPATQLVPLAGAAGGAGGTVRSVRRAAGHAAVTVALGIAVFLAWPLGDAARVTLANLAPQLGLVGRTDPGVAAAVAVGVAVPDPAPVVSAPPPAAAVAADLAAMRERIDGLAAGAEQMTRAVAGQARLAEEVDKVRDLAMQRLRRPAPAAAAPARVPLPERRPGRRQAAP